MYTYTSLQNEPCNLHPPSYKLLKLRIKLIPNEASWTKNMLALCKSKLQFIRDERIWCSQGVFWLSDSFAVFTGVRQGSILSPLLLIYIVEWIMMTATHDKNFGIQLEETLITDLDLADDIALLEGSINLA